MIVVTRLNGEPLVINSELIELVERTPDTVITLTTGRKLLVRESVEELIRRVLDYKRKIFWYPIPREL
ncbi:MAG TPA: endoflagellar protein [Candidatus Latescibacteria bacterium]|nr:endoflagellar protein [Candidatus Latescibacterota bacterium]